MLKRLFIGVGVTSVVLVGAGGVVYKRRLTENRSTTAEAFNAKQDQAVVEAGLANLGKPGAPPLVLYRYTTCPFCSKVKAQLDYLKVPHECVEVEPMGKKEIRDSDYKKVPQLRFGKEGPWLVDSTIIVDRIATATGNGAQLSDPEVTKWRDWAKDSLVRHLVVNLNSSLIEAWRGYDYIDRFDTIPWSSKLFLKVMGAPVMYLVAKMKTLPALKSSGELKEGDDIRAVLFGKVNYFVSEGLVNRPLLAAASTKGKTSAAAAAPAVGATTAPFHGGAAPDLADLDVYGVLQSIRGHGLYNDIVKNTNIQPWLDRMDNATGKSKYVVP